MNRVRQVREFGIDQLDVKEWNDLLFKSKVCDAFQTYEWAQVLRNSLDIDPYFLIVYKKGEPIGGILYLKKRIFSIADCYEVRGGPIYVNENETIVMENLLKFLKMKERKSLYLLFVPFPLIDHNLRKTFNVNGYHSVPFRTLIIDLKNPAEIIWNRLSKKARWGVRKAERLGVNVEVANNWQKWKEYYNLHVLHSKAKNYSTYPYNFFREMFKLHHKNMARLFLAEYRNQTIAGSLFLIYRKHMIFLQNASLDEFLKYNPNNLIQWRSIEWASANGISIYDINGLPWEKTSYLRGIYEYKKRWDGKIKWFGYYLNRRFLCSGIHIIRTSFLAWKLFSYLRTFEFLQR